VKAEERVEVKAEERVEEKEKAKVEKDKGAKKELKYLNLLDELDRVISDCNHIEWEKEPEV